MANKKKGKSSTVIIAIVCLTLLELVAILTGINGKYMMPIVALIAGLAGWVTPIPKVLKGGA